MGLTLVFVPLLPKPLKEALSTYPVHVLESSIIQRVVFAEAVVQGKAVYEIESGKNAALEINAVLNELLEYAK